MQLEDENQCMNFTKEEDCKVEISIEIMRFDLVEYLLLIAL